MSKQNQTEWRCPYCDGLNDWQDEVCQICGDGKRDEVVSAGKKKSSADSQQPKMQHQTQNQNTYNQQPTRKDVRSEKKQSAPEPEVRRSRPEPEIRKPKPEVKHPEPKEDVISVKSKKKRYWDLPPLSTILLDAAVLLAAGVYVFGIYKADTLVKNLDFTLLEEAPYSSLEDFKSWAAGQGYEVTTSKEGTRFFTDYSVDSGKTPWNITVSQGNHGIEIQYQADGLNLHETYKKLYSAVKEKGWQYRDFTENPDFLEGITGKKNTAVQLWYEKEKNQWYTLTMEDREITLVREDAPADSQELTAQVDLDFLQKVPQTERIQDSGKWLEEQGYSYVVSGREHNEIYDITLPQSTDWNVSYRGIDYFAVYNAIEKDCEDLPALYENLKAKLESSGFTIVCKEAETSERTDGSSGKFMIWQDAAGKLYDLSLWKGAYSLWSEVNLVKENSSVNSVDPASYDIKNPSDQLNIAALVTMPMDSYIGDESWQQKFKDNYGSTNFQPENFVDGDSFCRAEFRYYSCDQKTKKEILRYLKNEIQNATGQTMKLSSAELVDTSFWYDYEVETDKGCITVGSGASSGMVTVNIESNRD